MPIALHPVEHLRPLRVACAVAACGSSVGAAELLHMSQSSVVRAVQGLERSLDAPLFERSGRGMRATPLGTAMALRTQRALSYLAQADPAPRGTASSPAREWAGSRLATAVVARHLTVLLALAQAGSEAGAAASLGVSQSAVHQTLAQLEHIAASRLFLRARTGLRATEPCEQLVRACKLAMSELAQAGDEFAASRGLVQGRLVIGTLPFSTGRLLSDAADQVLRAYPGLGITIIDGTYKALVHQLRHADVDVIVGALRPQVPGPDLVQETLFVDRLAVVARAAHPLAQRPSLAWRALRDQDWIMPMPDTPAQTAFEQALQEARIAPPADSLRVNSALMMQALLAQSDRLALMSPRDVHREIAAGVLVVLDVPVRHAPRTIGMIHRAGYLPTPAARHLFAAMRDAAGCIAADTGSATSNK